MGRKHDNSIPEVQESPAAPPDGSEMPKRRREWTWIVVVTDEGQRDRYIRSTRRRSDAVSVARAAMALQESQSAACLIVRGTVFGDVDANGKYRPA